MVRLDRWMWAGAGVGLVGFVAWLIWFVFIYGGGLSGLTIGELVLGAFVMVLFSTLWAIVFALAALGVGAIYQAPSLARSWSVAQAMRRAGHRSRSAVTYLGG